MNSLFNRIILYNFKLIYYKKNKNKLISLSNHSILINVADIGLSKSSLDTILNRLKKDEEVIIGKVDQDGFLQSQFGSIKNIPSVPQENYIKRKRFGIYLIAIDGKVGIKKYYGNNKIAFLNELIALKVLSENHCNVPSIIEIDFDSLATTISYINGTVLKYKLREVGSKIFDRDLINSTHHTNESWIKRINEGKKNLKKVVDNNFIFDLKKQLKKIHSHRIVINDIKYGNIIIEEKTNKPYFIDFDFAKHYPNISQKVFNSLCSRDLYLFKLHFGNL